MLSQSLQLIYRLSRKTISHLTGITALQQAPLLAKNINLQAALDFLNQRHTFFSPASVRCLKKLYPYLMAEEERLKQQQNSSTSQKLILHFCCWGELYFEKVTTFLLPSLLAEHNLPFLAQHHDVTLLIHGDEKSRMSLMNTVLIKKIQQHATVQFIVIPDELLTAYRDCTRYPNFLFKKLNEINRNIKYFLVGGLQTLVFQLALQEKALVSFLMPDLMLSNHFYDRLYQMVQGKKVVLLTALRANYRAIKPELQRHQQAGMPLSIDASTLIKYHIKHLHTHALRQVVSEKTANFLPTAQIVFKIPHGYCLRALHYHPMLIDCAKINRSIKMDYWPIDNTIVQAIFDPNISFDKQAAVAVDTNQVYCIELSEEGPIDHTKANYLNYNDIVGKIRRLFQNSPEVFDTPYNRFLSSFAFHIVDPDYPLPDQEDDEWVDQDSFFLQVRGKNIP